MSKPSINPAAVEKLNVRLVYGHGRRIVHMSVVASGDADALRQAARQVAMRSRITEVPTAWEVSRCR